MSNDSDGVCVFTLHCLSSVPDLHMRAGAQHHTLHETPSLKKGFYVGRI